MYPYLRFTIDSTVMDLPKDGVNLTLSYSVFDAEDLAITGSNADRPVEFPSSKINDAVFGKWYDVSLSNLSQAEFLPCVAEVNGVPVISGVARLVDVETGNGFYRRSGIRYQAQIFGDNGAWIQQIIGLRLADLDWSNEQHEFSELLVFNALDADPLAGDNYGYAVMKTKNWGYHNSSTKAVTIFDCVPFLFIPAIFEAIFNKYLGYSINSNWLYKQATRRLILPCLFGDRLGGEYGNDFLNVRADLVTPTVYTGAVLLSPLYFSSQTYTPPQAPANPLQNGVGPVGTLFAGLPNVTTYYFPVDGYYQIEFSVTVGTTVSSPTVQIGTATDAIAATTVTTVSVSPTTGQILKSNVIFQAQAGQYAQFFCGVTSGVGDSVQITAGSLSITGETILSEGLIIDFKYLLKDWTVGQFLKGMTELFNLKFETNVPLQQVTIEPLDDWAYTQRTSNTGGVNSIETGFLNTVKDQTAKLDLRKNGTARAISDIENVWRFIYKQDGSDATVSKLQETGEFDMYESRYTLPNNRFKEDAKTVENSFFAPTLHVFDSSVQSPISLMVPQFPLLWPEDYTETQNNATQSNNFEPRLLWFGGQRGFDGNIYFYRESVGSVISIINPACFAVNYNDVSGFDVNLSYCNQQIDGFDVMGLQQRFFLKFFARKRAGKMVNDWLFLKATDILNLTFRSKVLINGDAFVLHRIEEFDPTTNDSTKVILEYDQTDSNADYTAFTDSPITGIYTTYKTIK